MAKAWDVKPTDIIRFVLRRDEYSLVIEALAGACAWTTDGRNAKAWDAVDILRNAEIDVDASAMVAALEKIAELTKHKETHVQEIVHAYASGALPKRVTPDAERE